MAVTPTRSPGRRRQLRHASAGMRQDMNSEHAQRAPYVESKKKRASAILLRAYERLTLDDDANHIYAHVLPHCRRRQLRQLAAAELHHRTFFYAFYIARSACRR